MTDTPGLKLNPRLPAHQAAAFETAWQKFSRVHPDVFKDAIGITTSGSTSGGHGSVIVLSQEALEVSAAAVNARLGASAGDKWGLALPLFHVGGYSIPVRARLSRSKVVSYDGAWAADSFVSWLHRESVTLLSLVPTQVFDIVESGQRSPPGLRAVIVGGGRLEDELDKKVRALGWPILQSFGMTECSSQVATALVDSDGRTLTLLDHVEARTAEDSRLSLRSKALLRARIRVSGEGSEIEFPVGTDGWFETNDRARLSGRTIEVLGRLGDSVKVVGELVDLVKVNSLIARALSKIGSARSSVVLALPSERRGHDLICVVEGEKDQVVMQELERSFAAGLAPFEKPVRIEFVNKFPRSPLGKILTSVLTRDLGSPRSSDR